eukprot:scaffold6587_cov103-Isochrysis_galbana.AAC.6
MDMEDGGHHSHASLIASSASSVCYALLGARRTRPMAPLRRNAAAQARTAGDTGTPPADPEGRATHSMHNTSPAGDV